MNNVRLAVNICTYKREEALKSNLDLLFSSKFFSDEDSDYYGNLDVFVTDNASELQLNYGRHFHLSHNKNTGGSGGFQRGLEEIRKCDKLTGSYEHKFTHVIFMDDDVKFELSCFYILFDFLRTVDKDNADRPVVGRMIDADNPTIQWTAAEKWNGGDITHIEHLRDISSADYQPGRVIYDADADYGGWWFCCYPWSFAKYNDPLPFFLHCDDVEYGLRCGKKPIIIEGVQVWHETWKKKMLPVMLYYDVRNPLVVNQLYDIQHSSEEVLESWKAKIGFWHSQQKWDEEYLGILGMIDYLKGWKWFIRLDNASYHRKLQHCKGNKIKNAIMWRIVEKLYLARKDK